MSKRQRRALEPVSLREAITAVGKELGLPPPSELSTLVDAWPEIVGAAIAAHASVRSVRDGVCTVEVDDPAWATQIRYAERQVLERAAVCCGPGVVTSVRVVVAAPTRGPKPRP